MGEVASPIYPQCKLEFCLFLLPMKRILGFAFGMFLLFSSIEDWINNVFPNEKVRITIGLILVLYFGKDLLENNIKKWW